MPPSPAATYRIQLGPSVTFHHLQSLTPYLDALGVSDCYSSPILTARAGSTHGYDICDHRTVNPELGTLDDLRALGRTLQQHGLGLIVDFVPNHMGIDPRTNLWWRDVLENGPSSPFARFFDIDWLPIKADLRNKVLLPILGDQYGAVLERGELRLAFRDGGLEIDYFDHNLPVNPGSVPLVIGSGLDRLAAARGHESEDVAELRGILASLSSLPPMSQTDSDAIETRRREKAGARARLATLTRQSSAVAAHIARVVEEFNGRPGEPRSFDQLHALLEVQAYRLSYWRTAFDEINYRRFFDINELAALRMEDPQVFAATHGLLLQLLEEGLVTGIRVDHPDGLYDPEAYFCALRQAAQRALADGGSTSPTYIVVEKILAAGERLRDSWPVNGTTGYNFLNVLNGVFVHPAGLSALRRTYRGFARHRETTADTAYASKWLVMRSAMASELNVLSRALNRLSELDRRSRDFTLNGLRRALTEIVACFPVYRTYVTARGASDDDLTAIATAVEAARRRNPAEEPSIFEFIRGHLAPQAEDQDGSGLREHSLAFAQKLQQYSAPVVAKGVEDTAFYRDVLLLSANEVGGDLRARARAVADLHADNVHRATRWPLEMTAASTHDTKRGEDARARINVISELAGEWRTMVKRWAALNALARQRIGGLIAPDRNDEWLFYQSLIGAWPAELVDAPLPAAAPSELIERMLAFMRKATKEAKRHTSWLHENEAYERAVTTFVRAVLGGDTAAVFLESFVPFGRRIAWFGMINSLSQLALRLASPGVPDIYQGSELWNFSLVDPDNRRPVDFSERRRALAAIEPLLAQADRHDERPLTLGPMLEQWPDGRVKLYTLVRALRLRRQHRDLFIRGSYEPFGATADHPHVIAFSRRHATDEIIVVAPRFVATLLRGEVRAPLGETAWGNRGVRLPERLKRARFVNLFTREVVAPAIVENEPRLLLNSALQTWPVGWFRVGR